jgi:cytosine/uracil/thiamine/allantoin permease
LLRLVWHQAWIGGEALHTFKMIVPDGNTARRRLCGHTTTEWISFLLFWGVNI